MHKEKVRAFAKKIFREALKNYEDGLLKQQLIQPKQIKEECENDKEAQE